MIKHRWAGTLEEAIDLLLFRASGWMVGDRATIALAFVCETARDRALTATGPGRGAADACCKKGAKLAEDWVARYKCPTHGWQDNPCRLAASDCRRDNGNPCAAHVAATGPGSGAAPQTDHRAAGFVASDFAGIQGAVDDACGTGAATPAATVRCDGCKTEDGCPCDGCRCCPKCSGTGRATPPSGSPPGAAEACTCKDQKQAKCQCEPCGCKARNAAGPPESPDGSRGTR